MTNLERLQKVADGLEELNEKVVYVGGSLSGLYATDAAAPEPRATMDVDCIVDYGSHTERELFEKWLRLKRFSEYQGDDVVICRWSFEGELVDIMPTDARFYGFTNKWYKQGMRSSIWYRLPNGRMIQILSVVAFVATKLETLLSRGGDDLRGEKDFEDIVYIMDCCPAFVSLLKDEQEKDVREFIINHFTSLISRPNIREEIECALPVGDEGREEIVLKMMKSCLQ